MLSSCSSSSAVGASAAAAAALSCAGAAGAGAGAGLGVVMTIAGVACTGDAAAITKSSSSSSSTGTVHVFRRECGDELDVNSDAGENEHDDEPTEETALRAVGSGSGTGMLDAAAGAAGALLPAGGRGLPANSTRLGSESTCDSRSITRACPSVRLDFFALFAEDALGTTSSAAPGWHAHEQQQHHHDKQYTKQNKQ